MPDDDPAARKRFIDMNELLPRERVQLALRHQDTDRVPVDFQATPDAWARLKAYLGIGEDEEVLRHLGIDLRHPRLPYIGPGLRRYSDGSWIDAWGVRRRLVPHGHGAYDEITRHPLADAMDPSELDQYPWPQAEWWDAKALADEIRRLDAQGSYAIVLDDFGDPGGVFEIGWYLRGMEKLLEDLVAQPDMAFAIMKHVADFYARSLELVMAAVDDRVDLIWTSDDIAHQQGMLMSLQVWRELIAPHHERLNRRIHELGTRVMYHSCGAVRPFIPDLIKLGVDVLDPLQFSAQGMNPDEIQTSFGGRLSFHGGIDVQNTLPWGTPEEVRCITRERIATLGRQGGYILAPTNFIQVDTPPENVVAMYSEAHSLAA
jgi:uroporphyrinogen decarboxylase